MEKGPEHRVNALKDRVALVTGGVNGIGASIVQLFINQGARVCFADLQSDKGLEFEKELNSKAGAKVALFVQCDVTNSQSLRNAFEATKKEFNQIDIVVNNAGVSFEEKSDWATLPREKWRRLIDINICGVIEGTQLGIEYMSKSGGGNGGSIVNISSMGAFYAMPITPIYSASKAAVAQFTRSLAHFAKSDGVIINALCPTWVDTTFIPDQLRQVLHPGSLLTPELVAESVLNLSLESRSGENLLMPSRKRREFFKPSL
eukprot:TRINITY_DN919_c0_g1_i1.p1 TRINITY_DN919_c0_g1~~TRINITY_DN919_c0_g1_i1.p1  ORF type:complete len:260 (-),score=41.65 TRINITY_DN919_c0_g1_i1:98-877(-)